MGDPRDIELAQLTDEQRQFYDQAVGEFRQAARERRCHFVTVPRTPRDPDFAIFHAIGMRAGMEVAREVGGGRYVGTCDPETAKKITEARQRTLQALRN